MTRFIDAIGYWAQIIATIVGATVIAIGIAFLSLRMLKALDDRGDFAVSYGEGSVELWSVTEEAGRDYTFLRCYSAPNFPPSADGWTEATIEGIDIVLRSASSQFSMHREELANQRNDRCISSFLPKNLLINVKSSLASGDTRDGSFRTRIYRMSAEIFEPSTSMLLTINFSH